MLSYSTVQPGDKVIVKSDKENKPEEKIVAVKSGPNANDIYKLIMEDGSIFYGLGSAVLKTA